jgi:hypothetical protein
MDTTKKSNYVQVRVWSEDKEYLDRLAAEEDESLPKVIHKIIEDRPQLGKNNLAYLHTEAKRSGKTIWQILDRIVLEHEARETFKRRNASLQARADSADNAELAEATQWHEFIAQQWADL